MVIHKTIFSWKEFLSIFPKIHVFHHQKIPVYSSIFFIYIMLHVLYMHIYSLSKFPVQETKTHTLYHRAPPTFSLSLFPTILSSPVKAPEPMNSILVVSMGMVSPLIFLEFLSGTMTVVPSSILRSPCWTPSPPTSLTWWCGVDTQAILSTSSRKTIPKM